MTQPPPLDTLRDACTIIAEDAAREIMRIYAGDHGVRDKDDKSPVTDADHAAEAVILAGLRKLTPDAVIIAEEEMAAGRVPTLDDGRPFWLVDPLDGTKEFIKRNGEFTVNIALVENGRPTPSRADPIPHRSDPMFNFIRNLVGVKTDRAVNNAIEAIVRWDPKSATEAELRTMEQNLDQLGLQDSSCCRLPGSGSTT